jgi:methylated-DNA-[protein]-cysteine S-methyltransferase
MSAPSTPDTSSPDTSSPGPHTPEASGPPGARRYTCLDSPVGELLLVADDTGLCSVSMLPWDEAPDTAGMSRDDDGPVLAEARRQLTEYFTGTRTDFDLPLSMHGSEFQRRVWRALTEIPYGETWSYGQLAEHLGDPKLTRAVGAANGRNPVAVVVPCHRVIGADGKLVGYAGGLDRKKTLLAHEARVAVEQNFG